jgi:hypothetical protein
LTRAQVQLCGIMAQTPQDFRRVRPIYWHMPRVVEPHPNHPAVKALLVLHSEIASGLLENKRQAKRLADDMRKVEAVIKMFDPAHDIRRIAVKRRKLNPWFRKGEGYRCALDALRKAEGPLTAREIGERMLASKGVMEATRKQVRDLAGSIQTGLRNHEGDTATRWRGLVTAYRCDGC